MTHNQIEYAKHKETQRSNLAKEAETHRSNVATELLTDRRDSRAYEINLGTLNENIRHNTAVEAETYRSNVAREIETNRANLAKEAETYRSNVAREQENIRHNVVSEQELTRHQQAQESETTRTNKAYESIGRTNAAANWKNAETNTYNAETNRQNADTRVSELEETSRHNVQNEAQAALNSVREYSARYRDYLNAKDRIEVQRAELAIRQMEADIKSGQLSETERNNRYQNILDTANTILDIYKASPLYKKK